MGFEAIDALGYESLIICRELMDFIVETRSFSQQVG